jgi:sarcosine dehydrogenase
MNEYRRLSTIGVSFGIESHILDPAETHTLFPLINPDVIVGSLYSPGDGVVDPAMLCTALTKAAASRGGKVHLCLWLKCLLLTSSFRACLSSFSNCYL